MQFSLPKKVLYILNTLRANGHAAYIVGGCVRDMLCDKTPADWDITTAAHPEEIRALFAKTIPTGIQHGTVTVLVSGEPFEVTTFRLDGMYENHRCPESVSFTDDIAADLSRRDFTMNAMAYHPEIGFIDPYGGEADIRNKLIRCVGDPEKRFDEDALRMLRAIRFAAQTGFTIDSATLTAIGKLAGLITSVSAERIRDELLKMLLSDRPEAICLWRETGLLAYILPELNRCFDTEQHIKYHCYDVGHHSVEVMRHIPPTVPLRLAALLHDIGKPDKLTVDAEGITHFHGHDLRSAELAKGILTRLRLDNDTKNTVLQLIRWHDREIVETKSAVRRAMNKLGRNLFADLLLLKRADSYGQNPVFLEARQQQYDRIEALYNEILAAGDALSLADLAVDGRDMMALGYQGKAIGEQLNRALAYVLEHPEQNQKELLLQKLQNNFAKTD